MNRLFAGDGHALFNDQPPVRRMEHTPHWLDVLRLTACPQCGSAAGWQCTGARGKARYAHHAARWRALRDALTPAAPLTQWEAYGMLAALIYNDGEEEMAQTMETEAADVAAPRWNEGNNEYMEYATGEDSMLETLGLA